MAKLTVVAISDTHGMHRNVQVPDGDVFIHCGDLCKYGQTNEVKDFAKWLEALPHKYKYITAGNHDKPIETKTQKCREIIEGTGARLFINEGVRVDGIGFWGSPTTPTFLNWHFMENRGPQIAKVWAQIPDDVDVLITHGPPYGHGSLAPPYRTSCSKEAGCLELLKRLKEMHNKTGGPKFHIFGHIHAGYGATQSDEFPGTTFINASVCTEQYQPTNAPMVFTVSKVV